MSGAGCLYRGCPVTNWTGNTERGFNGPLNDDGGGAFVNNKRGGVQTAGFGIPWLMKSGQATIPYDCLEVPTCKPFHVTDVRHSQVALEVQPIPSDFDAPNWEQTLAGRAVFPERSDLCSMGPCQGQWRRAVESAVQGGVSLIAATCPVDTSILLEADVSAPESEFSLRLASATMPSSGLREAVAEAKKADLDTTDPSAYDEVCAP